MKRNHRQPAAGHQQLFCRGEPAIEFPEFVVDRDTEGLERPCRRILPGLGCRHRRTHDFGELNGAPEGLAPLGRADRAGDPAGEALLAEFTDQFCELPFRQGGDEIRGLTLRLILSMARQAKRKAAFRRVELGRGDPEIESNAGDRAAG